MDLAPHYFPAEPSHDPGLNVAWWNLGNRPVAIETDGRPSVDLGTHSGPSTSAVMTPTDPTS